MLWVLQLHMPLVSWWAAIIHWYHLDYEVDREFVINLCHFNNIMFACTGNKFNDKAVEPIAELIKVIKYQKLNFNIDSNVSFQTSFHIKYLDLSYNEFGEESGEILGPAIGIYSSNADPYIIP